MTRCAIVTGAGTGIGAATARRLAGAGFAVVLSGRRREPLEAVARQIAEAGGTATTVAGDLGEREAPQQLAAGARAAFGRIDVLVNNAATIKVSPLEELSLDDFDRHVAVNVRAPFALLQASLGDLRAAPAAAVVNVSSSSATLVRPGQSIYGMSKAALEYLTRALAAELAADGIRVNAVALGPVDTPIHATWSANLDETYRWLADQVPLGRIGTADEVARWIELLVSPDAGWMTGTVIPVDGGQVLDRV